MLCMEMTPVRQLLRAVHRSEGILECYFEVEKMELMK